MGSHSKKRKKDKKRSRSRSRSSERYRSSRRRSPSRSRSRSPSYNSSSSKKKKHHRRSRSRSQSRSRRSSRSRSRDRSSRRSSRSRSRDRSRRSSRSWSHERSSRRSSCSRSRDRDKSTKHRRSRSRSRSRSAERRRRRSRSNERRSKRSKSAERQRSPERSSRGGSQDSTTKVKTEPNIKQEEEEEDIKLNPAEAIHQKMRKALEAAASADAKLREQGLLSSVKQEPLSRTEQLERDQVLQNLESDSFAPSAFVSTKDRQPQQSYLTKEQTHDNAIFGGVGVPNPTVNGAQTYSYGIPIKYKKRGQLASKYLSESAEVKEQRWIQKLQRMRRQKMEANPEYFNKLLTINADSPSRE